MSNTQFSWLIEGPGPCYLFVQPAGGHRFDWTRDPNKAIRFHTCEQADHALMAIRNLDPHLFPGTYGDPRPVEHGWLA